MTHNDTYNFTDAEKQKYLGAIPADCYVTRVRDMNDYCDGPQQKDYSADYQHHNSTMDFKNVRLNLTDWNGNRIFGNNVSKVEDVFENDTVASAGLAGDYKKPKTPACTWNFFHIDVSFAVVADSEIDSRQFAHDVFYGFQWFDRDEKNATVKAEDLFNAQFAEKYEINNIYGISVGYTHIVSSSQEHGEAIQTANGTSTSSESVTTSAATSAQTGWSAFVGIWILMALSYLFTLQ
jgi:hypothetical protein